MLSNVKRILIILVIITMAAFAGVLVYSKGRTYNNSEDEIGNTSGNIYNGGLFSEQDGQIYFSNDFDNGSLYTMDSYCNNIRKLSADKVVYINVDENYVYYIRANDTTENSTDSLMFNNTGVYRINQNGSGLKAITGDPSGNLILKGNKLFLQSYNVEDGIVLNRYELDGTKKRLLVEDAVVPTAVIDNYIYYTENSKNPNIDGLNLSSYTSHTYYKGSYRFPIIMGAYIYYIDTKDGNKIYRMNQDGSDPTLLVDEHCSTYNITNSGKYLYYQVDNGSKKKNHICRINLETMKEETLLKGSYKQINVTEYYVFFKNLKNSKIYLVSADGSPDIHTFNPLAPSEE